MSVVRTHVIALFEQGEDTLWERLADISIS